MRDFSIITLKDGTAFFVDTEDFGHVSKYNWFLSAGGYIVRNVLASEKNGRTKKTIFLHREIFGLYNEIPLDSNGFYIDHINRDKVDNRKKNLRVASSSQSAANRSRQKNNKSGFKGVSWNNKYQKWYARIMVSGESKFLGSFDSKEEAMEVYGKAAVEFFGEFSSLNFDVPYSELPLNNTSALSRRRVVGVKYVGEKHMLDLEVSHPKHNFLLPNGIVTSNSETLIHFWPSDRRKLYNSNKLIGRLKAQGQTEVDYSVLATQVNEKISGSATADEISNLMAAASTVSSDTPIVIGDDEVSVSQRFSAPIDAQPDVQVENNEAMSAIFAAAKELSVVERKLLRLKGVGL